MPLSGFCTGLLLVVEVIAGAGGGRFRNDALSSANADCTSVVDFLVLVFGAIRGASASTIDGVDTTENVGCVMVISGGGGAAFSLVLTGSSMTTVLSTVYFSVR